MTFSLVSQATIKAPDPSRVVVRKCPIRTMKGEELGRRRLLSLLAVSVAATLPEASESRKALLRDYLERSRKNKEKNDKERLDDYYRRNYKDYFDLVEGSVAGKEDEFLSETEKGIRDWLRANK